MSCSRRGKLLCKEHVARITECHPFFRDKPFRPQVERGVRLLLEDIPYLCKYCIPISIGNLDVLEADCSKGPRHCGIAGGGTQASPLQLVRRIPKQTLIRANDEILNIESLSYSARDELFLADRWANVRAMCLRDNAGDLRDVYERTPHDTSFSC